MSRTFSFISESPYLNLASREVRGSPDVLDVDEQALRWHHPPMNYDKVMLHRLAVRARMGATEPERMYPQRLELDLTAYIPRWPRGAAPDLERTVCYATLRKEAHEVAGNRPWVLLEELADALVARVFEVFPVAETVDVQVRKFVFPDAQWAGVSVTRERESYGI